MKIKRTHDHFYLNENKKKKPKDNFYFIRNLIEKDFNLSKKNPTQLKKIKLIDIGCATGDFAHFFLKKYPTIDYLGIDVMPKLLKKAKKDLPGYKFQRGNIVNLKNLRKKKFDVVCMLSVHGIWDEFEKWLHNVINLTSINGKAYIFGIFNPENLDVLVKLRKSDKNFAKNHWEPGWNFWSINTISKYLTKKKIKFKFHRWDITRSLPKKPDPLRSYTQKLNNRKYQLVTGAQIIYNLYALVVDAKKK